MQLTNLKTNFLGRNFIYYSEIDSTQDELWRRIEEQNIENGILSYGRSFKQKEKEHMDEYGILMNQKIFAFFFFI